MLLMHFPMNQYLERTSYFCIAHPLEPRVELIDLLFKRLLEVLSHIKFSVVPCFSISGIALRPINPPLLASIRCSLSPAHPFLRLASPLPYPISGHRSKSHSFYFRLIILFTSAGFLVEINLDGFRFLF
ncbi:uncharacterized protein BDR25DRAFT_362857 [Lindgomyces ingoldianus]|uniref:Uncharacterized protein n=1 Tax=Lindgomyces ingoldianus TaxID=673940 RepID=A0ACB6Q8V1_9PLEO|nr:uncharacterized protein BDR25DRAFT_362857 [Lindgomyces ingoldianus]KAF2463307.1 hypothetical protein BDR25DRAFT_362857 [Lindgomyces ingoldianus]